MTVGFYSAAQGIFRMQDGMDITSNNIANINTHGFQASRPAFSDLIYTIRKGMEEDTEIGHGVKLDTTNLMFREGAPVETNRDLDFCLTGEALFAIGQPDGTIRYTKDGGFEMTQMGDQNWYLVDDKGNNVLTQDLQPVVVPFEEGTEIPDLPALTGLIGAFSFPNPYGLMQAGDNYFTETDSSGAAQASLDTQKLQGWLESSGTGLASEMSNVIVFQKAFSANAKMVQTADELAQIVNGLRQ